MLGLLVHALTESDDRSLKTISSICSNRLMFYYSTICVSTWFGRDAGTYMPQIAIVEVNLTLPSRW
jgi:hypothetical protein